MKKGFIMRRSIITITDVPVSTEVDIDFDVNEFLDSLDSDDFKTLYDSMSSRMSDDAKKPADVDLCSELFDRLDDYDRRRVLCRCFNAVNYDDSRSVLDGVSRLF